MNQKALHKISYGMYVVSSKMGGRLNGQIANTVMQITSDPPRIAVCINKGNLTHEFIKESGVFTASVLSVETPMKFIGRFGFKSGRDIEKFDGVNHRVGTTGAPIVLDHALAYFEAEVIASMDGGTHTLFLGNIVDAEILDSHGVPMTYAYYHQIRQGKSPKTAPTYINEEKKAAPEPEKAAKYECSVCGYVYDPEVGDPDSGIVPGTPFEDLADDWVCPVCGVGKDEFVKLE